MGNNDGRIRSSLKTVQNQKPPIANLSNFLSKTILGGSEI